MSDEHDFVNVDEALSFMSACTDPLVCEVLWRTYATMVFFMNDAAPSRQVDVLYIMKLLQKMLSDPDCKDALIAKLGVAPTA